MANRQRNINVHFMVTPRELELLRKRMDIAGYHNMGAYLRAMAFKGHIINFDMPELLEAGRLLQNVSNNINQIARRVNQTGSAYKSDIDDIRERCGKLEDLLGGALTKLTEL